MVVEGFRATASSSPGVAPVASALGLDIIVPRVAAPKARGKAATTSPLIDDETAPPTIQRDVRGKDVDVGHGIVARRVPYTHIDFGFERGTTVDSDRPYLFRANGPIPVALQAQACGGAGVKPATGPCMCVNGTWGDACQYGIPKVGWEGVARVALPEARPWETRPDATFFDCRPSVVDARYAIGESKHQTLEACVAACANKKGCVALWVESPALDPTAGITDCQLLGAYPSSVCAWQGLDQLTQGNDGVTGSSGGFSDAKTSASTVPRFSYALWMAHPRPGLPGSRI